jgi:polygalacturonase
MRRLGIWLALLLGILGLVACGSAASSDGSGDDALDGSDHRKADAGSGHGQDGGGDGGTRSSDGGGTSDGGKSGDSGSDSSAPPSDGGTARGAYVLHETFDAMTTGAAPASPWTTTETSGGAVSVTETPFAADKSVALTKPAGTGQSALSVGFPAQSGRVVFEAKVLTRETAGFKAIPYIYDAAGNAVASVSFQDGSIQTHVGSTITMVQSFVAGEWYRVRVVVDTGAGTFDLYLDGERALAAQALRTASASVARLSYYADSTSAETLLVDNVKVYTEAAFIGAPPAPVFDARSYGAVGDGTTMDTAAIQQAVDAAAGTGGSVLLKGGTFLSGTVTLKSGMTFFLDSSATLLGSRNAADYPTQTPDTGNTQLLNCQRALLYIPDATGVTLDGGGMLDGQGDSFSGLEGTRPMLVWSVKGDHLTVQNVSLRKGAVWSLVTMETDDVLITNVGVSSNGITHDGIDIVDGSNITVDDVAVRAGDDAMCLKSGVRRGIDGLTVKNSLFGGEGTSGGSNGIKIGTATYGALTNITLQDDYVKEVQYAAMAVESRQGSDISGVAFSRIEFAGTGGAFFVYLAQQDTDAPTGDVPKLGSVNGVSFTDITGATRYWGSSPHQGTLVTGQIYNGVTYPIENLSFTRVAVTFDGGLTRIPGNPVEATPDQYPEANMFGDLPAWGYYLRHVQGVTFDTVTSSLAASDAREKVVTDDVAARVGSP